MNFFISLFLSITIYIFIIIFLFYFIDNDKEEVVIKNNNVAYIHKAIIEEKDKPTKAINPKKNIIKEKVISSDTKEISKDGEKDIDFDDIFENIDSNTNDIKKIKMAKKEVIVNNKKEKSLAEYVQEKSDKITFNDMQINVSNDVNSSNNELEKFYVEVYNIWESYSLNIEDTAIVKFSYNNIKMIYTNLNDSIKSSFIKKLQSLDLSSLNGSITITFRVKEKK
jgi:hypothetical protein